MWTQTGRRAKGIITLAGAMAVLAFAAHRWSPLGEPVTSIRLDFVDKQRARWGLTAPGHYHILVSCHEYRAECWLTFPALGAGRARFRGHPSSTVHCAGTPLLFRWSDWDLLSINVPDVPPNCRGEIMREGVSVYENSALWKGPLVDSGAARPVRLSIDVQSW